VTLLFDEPILTLQSLHQSADSTKSTAHSVENSQVLDADSTYKNTRIMHRLVVLTGRILSYKTLKQILYSNCGLREYDTV
jgi:hypothetical protein